MKLPQLHLRDLFWLVLVVGLGCGLLVSTWELENLRFQQNDPVPLVVRSPDRIQIRRLPHVDGVYRIYLPPGRFEICAGHTDDPAVTLPEAQETIVAESKYELLVSVTGIYADGLDQGLLVSVDRKSKFESGSYPAQRLIKSPYTDWTEPHLSTRTEVLSGDEPIVLVRTFLGEPSDPDSTPCGKGVGAAVWLRKVQARQGIVP